MDTSSRPLQLSVYPIKLTDKATGQVMYLRPVQPSFEVPTKPFMWYDSVSGTISFFAFSTMDKDAEDVLMHVMTVPSIGHLRDQYHMEELTEYEPAPLLDVDHEVPAVPPAVAWDITSPVRFGGSKDKLSELTDDEKRQLVIDARNKTIKRFTESRNQQIEGHTRWVMDAPMDDMLEILNKEIEKLGG